MAGIPSDASISRNTLPVQDPANAPLVEFIKKSARSIYRTELAIAVMAWMVIAVGLLLSLILVDHWLWPLSSPARYAVWVGFVGFSFIWMVGRIAPLLGRRINPEYAAKRLETLFPEMQDGLISWIQLATKESGISRGVLNAVGRLAFQQLRGQDANLVVDQFAPIKLMAVLIGILLTGAVYLAVAPKSGATTLYRILMPWANISPATRVQILSLTPGDATVTEGTNLRITMQVRGWSKSDLAEVTYSTDDGQTIDRIVPMKADLEGLTYLADLGSTFGGIVQPLHYSVRAGDAQLGPFAVKVQLVPLVILDQVEYHYPKYTRLKPRIVEGEGDVEGPAGTKITVRAHANQMPRKARLEFNLRPTVDQAFQIGRADDAVVEEKRIIGEWRLELNEAKSNPSLFAYRLRFENSLGELNASPIVYEVKVIPDLAPEIDFADALKESIDLPVDRTLKVGLRASDPDFGLTKLALRATLDGHAVSTRELFEDGIGVTGQVIREYTLDPAALKLRPGQKIEFVGFAYDNRCTGSDEHFDPNVRQSRTIQVTIQKPSGNNSQEANPKAQPPGQGAVPPKPGQPAEANNADKSQPDAESKKSKNSDANSPERKDTQSEDHSASKSLENGTPNNSRGSEQENSQSGKSPDAPNSSSDESNSTSQSDNATSGAEQSGSQSQPGQQQSGAGKGSESNGSSGGAGGQDSPEGTQDSGKKPSGATSGSSESKDGKSSSSGVAERGAESQSGSSGSTSSGSGGNLSSGDSSSGTPSKQLHDGEAFERLKKWIDENSSANEKSSKPSEGNSKSSQNQSSGSNDNSSREPSNGSGKPSDASKGSKSASGEHPSDGRSDSSGNSTNEKKASSESSNGDSQSTKPDSENKPSAFESSNGATSTPNDKTNSTNGNRDQSTDQGKPSPNKDGSTDSSNSDSNNMSEQRGADGRNQSSSSEQNGNQPAITDNLPPSDPKDGKNSNSPGESRKGGNESSKNAKEESSHGDAKEQDNTSGSTDSSSPGGQAGNLESKADGKADERSKPAGKSGPTGSSAANSSPKNPGEQGSASKKANDDENGANAKTGDSQGKGQNGLPNKGNPSGSSDPGGKSNEDPSSGNSSSSNSSGASQRGNRSGEQGNQNSNIDNHDSVAGPTSEESEKAEAELAYARQATDMVLKALDRQRNQPDPELLKRMGWTKEQLQAFVDRWKNARESSSDPSKQKHDYDDMLRSLGLVPQMNRARAEKEQNDSIRGLREEGSRVQPPPAIRERFDAFRRSSSAK